MAERSLNKIHPRNRAIREDVVPSDPISNSIRWLEATQGNPSIHTQENFDCVVRLNRRRKEHRVKYQIDNTRGIPHWLRGNGAMTESTLNATVSPIFADATKTREYSRRKERGTIVGRNGEGIQNSRLLRIEWRGRTILHDRIYPRFGGRRGEHCTRVIQFPIPLRNKQGMKPRDTNNTDRIPLCALFPSR